MDKTIVDKKRGKLTVLAEDESTVLVVDKDGYQFWIPKAKLQIIEPKRKRGAGKRPFDPDLL